MDNFVSCKVQLTEQFQLHHKIVFKKLLKGCAVSLLELDNFCFKEKELKSILNLTICIKYTSISFFAFNNKVKYSRKYFIVMIMFLIFRINLLIYLLLFNEYNQSLLLMMRKYNVILLYDKIKFHFQPFYLNTDILK